MADLRMFVRVSERICWPNGYEDRPGIKLVRSPYQTCAEMLSLLRTHTEQLKWTSKREKSMGKTVRKRMHGAPEPGAPAPATGHSPRILFPTAFPIDFLRFEVHFSCSAWVLRRDSISAHVWYGLRTNLGYELKGPWRKKWAGRRATFPFFFLPSSSNRRLRSTEKAL